MLVAVSVPARAADYSFAVDRNKVDVHIKQDGSVDIEYWITFTVDRGARAIDVVDVGMPNGYFSRSAVTADVDGAPVASIGSSPYVAYGFAVNLGSRVIRAGETGTVHVKANCGHMVYRDTTDSSYASVEFSPTWFGSSYAHGKTDLEVSIFFPPGVGPDETRYHRTAFTEAKQVGDTRVMTWRNPSASPSRQYTYGVSFPASYVASHQIYSAPATTRPTTTTKRTTGDDGGSDFGWVVPVAIFGFVGLRLLFSTVAGPRRKMTYLPPAIAVEGVRVKEGLTPVEAAIITETPLERVLSMILFSSVRKGLVRVVKADPLKLEAVAENRGGLDGSQPLKEFVFDADGSYAEVTGPRREKPASIASYEADLVKAITKGGRLNRRGTEKLLVSLIHSVQRKMKGYAAKPTAEHFRGIVSKALDDMTRAGTPQVTEENLAWAMMDGDFEKRMAADAEPRGLSAFPWYWAFMGPRPALAGAVAGDSGLEEPATGRGFGSVFGRLTYGVVPSPAGLRSSVMNVTNPAPATSGGGGGGGGCACACAGCACACAGGGR